MKGYTTHLLAALAATSVSGHGVITEVQGANKVTLPGLSLIDGTPRDCPTPICGAEADTSIIRTGELGTQRASALGRSQGGGPVDIEKMMALFMNREAANSTAVAAAREKHQANRAAFTLVARQALGGLGGVLGGGGGVATPRGIKEAAVLAATGAGASGLPTTADDGTVHMTFHQVNQDGAGPLTAAIDTTSGGKDPAAFKTAKITTNVPGLGIAGISAAQVMDYPVVVQMPAGTICQGAVGGASNVCVARLANQAVTGPFGGSVVFTQSPAARKRAIEYTLAKRSRVQQEE